MAASKGNSKELRGLTKAELLKLAKSKKLKVPESAGKDLLVKKLDAAVRISKLKKLVQAKPKKAKTKSKAAPRRGVPLPLAKSKKKTPAKPAAKAKIPKKITVKKRPKIRMLPVGKIKSKKKKQVMATAAEPAVPRRRGGEEEIESTKFYVAPQPPPSPAPSEELPLSYGRNRIVLLVRDPEWIFSYWEITPERLREAEGFFGGEWGRTKTVLRVYDVTDIRFDGGNAHSHYDIEVTGNAVNWYLHVGKPDTGFIVDIARITPGGKFFVLARSNAVRTPRNRMSDVVDEEWMSLDFDRVYALSGGLPRGASSAQVRRIVEKGLNLGLSSDSSPGNRKTRVAHG